MSYALPFARGEVWQSSEQGTPPSAIMGKMYMDPGNGQIIQCVRNTDASVIRGGRLVKWETGSRKEVDRVVASGSLVIAGVSDPEYLVKGKTVPVNAAFWIVKQGLTHVIAGATMVVGKPLVSDSAASSLAKGYGQPGVNAASAGVNGSFVPAIGGTILASANALASCLCAVRFA